MTDLDYARLYVFGLGILGLGVTFYIVVAMIARRQIRKAMRGYLMARTIQPRDAKGRFVRP
jgi:predicted exporter